MRKLLEILMAGSFLGMPTQSYGMSCGDLLQKSRNGDFLKLRGDHIVSDKFSFESGDRIVFIVKNTSESNSATIVLKTGASTSNGQYLNQVVRIFRSKNERRANLCNDENWNRSVEGASIAASEYDRFHDYGYKYRDLDSEAEKSLKGFHVKYRRNSDGSCDSTDTPGLFGYGERRKFSFDEFVIKDGIRFKVAQLFRLSRADGSRGKFNQQVQIIPVDIQSGSGCVFLNIPDLQKIDFIQLSDLEQRDNRNFIVGDFFWNRDR